MDVVVRRFDCMYNHVGTNRVRDVICAFGIIVMYSLCHCSLLLHCQYLLMALFLLLPLLALMSKISGHKIFYCFGSFSPPPYYQNLDSGEEHPKTIGTSKKNVKLNRFANITVCELLARYLLFLELKATLILYIPFLFVNKIAALSTNQLG